MHATTTCQITNTTSPVTGVPPGAPSAAPSVRAPGIPAVTPALTEGALLPLALTIAAFAMIRIKCVIRTLPDDLRRY
ncbi:MAG: hypothetical protein BGP24_09440 [Lysobacterales bacterium 69-70]|nr:hypothetical protein [Xanthomonadaceae bacterium]ODU33182.1 MAG: hypothetical protein ABS97_12465 [Xanthomonadaceae bacterium SCN 69-320]ODV20491.1 MAG: hypothetical protein ABT27_07205 [Xanthomonadaceae bacterium SCN 69-25]OJZ00727.1 MAG: hypothetical protein BGP24_09440 [Xanthomonadales bacterium 69-70]